MIFFDNINLLCLRYGYDPLKTKLDTKIFFAKMHLFSHFNPMCLLSYALSLQLHYSEPGIKIRGEASWEKRRVFKNCKGDEKRDLYKHESNSKFN